MSIEEIIQKLHLTVLTTPKDFASIQPNSGYCSDLLSCVMAGANPGDVWVTLQAHINIVAVAALTECSAVVISEGAIPEPDVLAKANSQGVTLLGSNQKSFQIVGQLWELGIR
jgi:hypothetical protein